MFEIAGHIGDIWIIFTILIFLIQQIAAHCQRNLDNAVAVKESGETNLQPLLCY